MAEKTVDGVARATAEDLVIVTPETVPDTVVCYITKKQIPGAEARLVEYAKGKNQWVHKRFVGETDVAVDDDDDIEERFAFEEDLTLPPPPPDDDDDDSDA